MSAAGTPKALRELADANMGNAKSWFKAQIDVLSEAVADASSTFSMAPSGTLIELCGPFVENLEVYLDDLSKRLSSDVGDEQRVRLKTLLAPEQAYLAGFLEGGGVALAIQTAFPEGDWDDPAEVKKVLRKRLDFVGTRVAAAVSEWAQTYNPAAAVPSPSKAAAPSAGNKLEALLAFAEGIGVRIKKVPASPSDTWVNKLEAKLQQVAKKKGVAFELPSWGDIPENDDLTSARPAGPDPAHDAARKERIETMLAKAEKAELKLGRIPEEPTDAWLDETEAKLKAALERRKAKRKAERERKTKQRKERIARLQKHAQGVGIELGKIPPFPTEDWIARSEMRVATEMLKRIDSADSADSGRAERLKNLLSNAASLGMDLDVPPDPDGDWFDWAEAEVTEAEAADELLMAGEAEEVYESAVLYYEEGTVQEQAWPLEGDSCSIGRTRKNDVALPHDAQISRSHCVLRLDGDHWMAEDLKSTRGTLVNGKAIKKPTALTDGDTIQTGDTVLVFRTAA